MAPPRFPSSVIGGTQPRTVPRDSKGPARERTGPVGNDPREAKPPHAPSGHHTASGIAPGAVPRTQQAPPIRMTREGWSGREALLRRGSSLRAPSRPTIVNGKVRLLLAKSLQGEKSNRFYALWLSYSG